MESFQSFHISLQEKRNGGIVRGVFETLALLGDHAQDVERFHCMQTWVPPGPDKDALGRTEYCTHEAHLPTPFLQVLLFNAYRISPNET